MWWLLHVARFFVFRTHDHAPCPISWCNPTAVTFSWIDSVRTWIAGRYWGRMARAGGVPTWMGERVVRERINTRIAGSPGVWPTDWLGSKIETPVERGVSLGCGEGALERDLVTKGICRYVLGIDASSRAIELARERAAALGMDQLSYRTGTMNRPELTPSHYGAAFFHQSLHHVADLHRCLRSVHDALDETGWLYLDEYVGPSRTSWNRSLLADAQAVYDTLPEATKRHRRLGYPIDRRDPTEAVQSGRILSVLEQYFDVVEQRDYGGNLLALIHPNLELDLLSDPERDLFLEALLDVEDELLRKGARSYYTVILARPKSRIELPG